MTRPAKCLRQSTLTLRADRSRGLRACPAAPLLRAERLLPRVAVGHSAGAAIAVQVALAGALADVAGAAVASHATDAADATDATDAAVLHSAEPTPAATAPTSAPTTVLVSLNGAFLPFGGLLAPLFSPLTRLLYSLPAVARLFARRAADPEVVRRLVEGTGSTLDEAGLALYGRLMRCPRHTRAALGLMAHWEQQPQKRSLPRLALPLHLLAGEADRAVPPSQARRVQALVPGATHTLLPRLGHLAHEEDAVSVSRALQAVLAAAVPSGATPAGPSMPG